MHHVTPISLKRPQMRPAATTSVESLVMTFFSLYFSDYQNFAPVMQNLQKYYGKT